MILKNIDLKRKITKFDTQKKWNQFIRGDIEK
jgi:hypothetical protein